MENNRLTRLRLEFDTNEIGYKKASAMQGVLFEKMNAGYADKMHTQQLHPYSQYLRSENGKSVWYVNTLSNEAREAIIEPLLDDSFDSFVLKHGGIKVGIDRKILTELSYAELMRSFYGDESSKNIELELLSLMSFKQSGHYTVLPDMRLIYQSLMMKYSAVATNDLMIDDDTLEQLVENSFISGYRLHTGSFPLEGQKIPGFMGTMRIMLKGSETLRRYIKMLLTFGEFSGIGIKTGMGMGAIRIVEENK